MGLLRGAGCRLALAGAAASGGGFRETGGRRSADAHGALRRAPALRPALPLRGTSSSCTGRPRCGARLHTAVRASVALRDFRLLGPLARARVSCRCSGSRPLNLLLGLFA
jgi:hypothetical protein